MSYSDDCIKALNSELRRTKELVLELKKFNDNAATLKRIADALERQNELKELEIFAKQKTLK